ncbi:MAG TPA: zf-HC2 domain-containing protein, partial [Candidatus Eisenbacteria bacterium]
MSLRNDPIHPPSEDLFAYRDGELGPEKRALIEAHVMGCSICRSFINQVSSLEFELRLSPDRAPSDYLERLHETVRARIAAGGVKSTGAAGAARTEDMAAAPDAHGRVGSWRERERRRGGADGDEGRIKEVPGLPWAAVISTASAAAAVLVVVVILIKQGIYQQVVAPKAPSVAVRAPGEAAPGDSGATSNGMKSDVGATEREAASGSLARLESRDQDAEEAKTGDAKLEASGKDQLRTRENLGLAGAADRAERARLGAVGTPESRTSEFREAPPAASKGVEELQKKAANA